MSWFWTMIFLSFTFSKFSEANNQKKLPSAVFVVGSVYCDTCFQHDFPKASHFISGASVAVECKDTSSRPTFRQEVKTNSHGEFKVHLPFSVSKHVKKIKGCSVKLISSNEPFCAVAAVATSSSLRLKSRKEGTHIFSAGFFTFKPLKEPEVCDQKPSINKNFKNLNADKSSVSNPNDLSFLPPILDPPPESPVSGLYLPPLPLLPKLPPLPLLPRLPPLPGIPYLPPVPKKETDIKPSQLVDLKVNNQPMSPVLPWLPNPFETPSSIIPPIFPSFPLPPLLNLPLIPGLTPSPSLPTTVPPFPFQPTPGFPGLPSAEVSSQSKTIPP